MLHYYLPLMHKSINFYVSQFTGETYSFTYGFYFSEVTIELFYIIGTGMPSIFHKIVGQSACNAAKNACSFYHYCQLSNNWHIRLKHLTPLKTIGPNIKAKKPFELSKSGVFSYFSSLLTLE